MPSFTKRAIIESFLRLVGKKPLEKITVRDIVDDCGINRNTFYYYFQDIYAVLEDVFHDMIGSLPDEETLGVTLAAFYRVLAAFCASHPSAAKNLAFSLGFEGLERYFSTDIDGVIMDCCVRVSKTVPAVMGIKILRHALLGLCLDTMRGNKDCPYDIGVLERILSPLSEAVCRTDKN